MGWSLRKALGLLPKPFDPIDNPYAKATTPDRLISAHFIESFVKDFDNWRAGKDVKEDKKVLIDRHQHEFEVFLKNRKTGLRIEWEMKREYDVKSYHHFGVIKHSKTKVKGIPLDPQESERIFLSWIKIKKQHDETKRVAAAALAKMKEEDAKWNLAESLLGLKRNEFGALVPINPVQE